MANTNDLLRRPLYVYDLPEEILLQLEHIHDDARPQDEKDELAAPVQEEFRPLTTESGSSTGTFCTLCGVQFEDVQEQRRHVKSDFHAYNLKQKIKGLRPVKEQEFEALLGDLDESISGSDSSESDDEDDNRPSAAGAKDDILSALLKKQARISAETGSSDESSSKKIKKQPGRSPFLWFKSSALASNTRLGIYRAIFTDQELTDQSHLLDTIRAKQLPRVTAPNVEAKASSNSATTQAVQSPHFFLCMIGGGHFAAMLVSLAPKVGKKSTGAEERQATVLAHKTFHRYTTRRKQGGAQSSNDAAKGAAHSAGSSLRRYNEVALTNEVRELLGEWKPMIDSAQLLFIRASGATNKRTLYGPYEGQVLRANDSRIRGFPFSTRRATQAELMRAFVELTRVKVSQVDEAALAAAKKAETEQAAKNTSATRPSKSTDSPAAKKLSEEEAASSLHTSQLLSLIRRSKAPAVISYIRTNSIPSNFKFYPTDSQQHHHAPTPLHFAASNQSPTVVHALLVETQADPTITNGQGKPPFDLAGDRPTRDAFRVARHQLGEGRWDWAAAHVPTALSKAEADKRDERDRKEASEKEEERRKAGMERLRREAQEQETSSSQQQQRKAGVGKGLGTAEKTGAEKREEEARGMTPEMRMRLERERRARAAEERIRRMQAGRGGG